jgi:hypothetical protein
MRTSLQSRKDFRLLSLTGTGRPKSVKFGRFSATGTLMLDRNQLAGDRSGGLSLLATASFQMDKLPADYSLALCNEDQHRRLDVSGREVVGRILADATRKSFPGQN